MKQYGCFKINAFFEKSGRLSAAGLNILAFGSYSLSNFQPILDCFISNFKLKYEDSENTETKRVNTVVSTYINIKQRNFFFGAPGI